MQNEAAERTKNVMRGLASGIDDVLNGGQERGQRTYGFVLLVAKFGDIEGGRVNYVSNGEKAEMISMLKEYLARLEGRYQDGGRA